MVRTFPRHVAAAITAAVLTANAASSRADDTYIGLNTNWSNPNAWSNNVPPTSSDNVFILPTVFGGTNTLTLDTFAPVNNLVLGANGGGTATLALQSSSIIASSITIQNSGRVTGTGSLQGALNNAGVITSNSTMTLQLTGASANSGTILGTAASLQLSGSNAGTLFDNTGGTISAAGNFTTFVDISNLTLVGGNITSSGSNSALRVTGTSSFADVTISGSLQNLAQLSLQDVTFASGSFNENGPLNLAGDITNNANWTSNGSLVSITAPVNIKGNGTIALNNASWNSATGGTSLTVGRSGRRSRAPASSATTC